MGVGDLLQRHCRDSATTSDDTFEISPKMIADFKDMQRTVHEFEFSTFFWFRSSDQIRGLFDD